MLPASAEGGSGQVSQQFPCNPEAPCCLHILQGCRREECEGVSGHLGMLQCSMRAVLLRASGGHQPRVLLASTVARGWWQGPGWALTLQTKSMAERTRGGSSTTTAPGRCPILPAPFLSHETAGKIERRDVCVCPPRSDIMIWGKGCSFLLTCCQRSTLTPGWVVALDPWRWTHKSNRLTAVVVVRKHQSPAVYYSPIDFSAAHEFVKSYSIHSTS